LKQWKKPYNLENPSKKLKNGNIQNITIDNVAILKHWKKKKPERQNYKDKCSKNMYKQI
jgi:hypothetical protein